MLIKRVLLAFLAIGLTAQTTAAADWDEFWHEFDVHRRRVASWPQPFSLPEREAVRAPFRTMVDNGWQMQTTLVHAMFSDETNDLTYGGKLHVRWILTQTPPHRRHIYVLEGSTQEQTAARVQAVYAHLAEVAPGMPTTCVTTTQVAPTGAPGYYMDEIHDAYRATIPQPRLSGYSRGGGGGGMLQQMLGGGS